MDKKRRAESLPPKLRKYWLFGVVTYFQHAKVECPVCGLLEKEKT